MWGGGTVTGALSSLQTELSGKADSTHSHTTGDLPVTNSLSTNSASYIPSSSAVYSLQSLINDLNTEIQNMNDQLDPNNRYESKSLGTWSSVSDVDTFLSRFNHDNLYKDGDTELAVGNYVTIKDGTYNVNWAIAGFDLEHNQLAADGTIYDNGYGICLIQTRMSIASPWNTTNTISGGYISSHIHTTTIPAYMNYMRTVLGSHIVARNVLLSSDTDENYSTAYTWTTAEAALMSAGQWNGVFATCRNKYDDGEATYKLPLFDHERLSTFAFTLRGISSKVECYMVPSGESYVSASTIKTYRPIRPMIYIR